jgi:hypothetical protein
VDLVREAGWERFLQVIFLLFFLCLITLRLGASCPCTGGYSDGRA